MRAAPKYAARAPLTFRVRFRNSRLGDARALWPVFEQWQKMRANQIYDFFEKDMLQSQQAAKEAVENWPSPFPNAKKGVPYKTEFEIPKEAIKFQFEGLKAAGLSIVNDPANERFCVVSGVPETAGEFPIVLRYIGAGFARGMKILTRDFKLIVNPDPRELWKNEPSDQNMEYARPDEEAEQLQCQDGALFAASLRGRSHAHNGLPRDDAFALGCHAGWQLLALSDGAGSAAFSRRGAELACQTALRICADCLDALPELDPLFLEAAPGADKNSWLPKARQLAYGILCNAAFEAQKAIRAEAAVKGRDARAYAATLLLAIVKKFPAGWAALSFQIGDGAMAAITADGAELLGEPDEGEYGGQTRFVTMNEIFEPNELMRRLRVLLLPEITGVLLLTDGVSDPRFAAVDNLSEPALWRGLWQELLPLAAGPRPAPDLLNWLNFWERGSHDDRTLAMFVPEA